MKNLFCTLTLIFSIFSVIIAQDSPVDKGVILMKGGSNFNLSLSDGTPTILTAGGAYFFFDKIPIGADISYTGFDGESTTSIEPFARYYFKETLFGGAKIFQGVDSSGDDAFKIAIQGGYVWYLNDYVAVEPTVEYPLQENASLSIKVGFSIYY